MDQEVEFERASPREKRRETNWVAMIRLPDGSEIPTTVKGISPSSARLAVPSSYALPNRFLFKVAGRDFVCAVEMVWRDGDQVEVSIERVRKLTGAHVKRTTQAAALRAHS
ncbi:hypothetical protein [Methylobacterium trifolii]|uniref:PilZ domain-containing protein n=1 Tax=Methylobacterium trifolii TaxID=1003092 RepID=A0ABQ4TV50_9HYPH|nr:hypothetical protein [Methylobacterium trifolii]GJE59110.1 hypothetical protein MPOCJGCO_1197 [Methylobacterium trifolii]